MGRIPSDRTWIWIIAIMSAVAIIGGVLGPIIVHALDTPFGRGFKAGLAGAIKGQAGANAPGAKEVQKVGRCQAVNIVSGNDIAKEKDIEAGSAFDLDFVICILPAFGPDATCEDLAKTYVDAVQPKRRFMVEVKHLGGSQMLCQRTFDTEGELLTDYLKK